MRIDYNEYNDIYVLNSKSTYCGRIVIVSFYGDLISIRRGKVGLSYSWVYQCNYIGSGDLLTFINKL